MRFLKIILVALAFATIAGGLYLWRLPAEVGYRFGSRYLGPVALSGLRGTAWEGHADGVSVFGRDLGEVDWHAQKMPLLGGRFVADVRLKGADVDVAGEIERGGGRIEARDLRFSVPAELLAPLFDADGMKLLGTVSGVVTQAVLAQTRLSDVHGNARWSHAGVATDAETRLPDVLAEFASQADGSVAGSVRDDGSGDLVIDGTFTVRIGAFDALATLRARNDNANVAEMLRHVGESQPDGSTRLQVHSQSLKVF